MYYVTIGFIGFSVYILTFQHAELVRGYIYFALFVFVCIFCIWILPQQLCLIINESSMAIDDAWWHCTPRHCHHDELYIVTYVSLSSVAISGHAICCLFVFQCNIIEVITETAKELLGY